MGSEAKARLRWTILGSGIIVLLIGAVAALTAHAAHPVEIDGTLAHNYVFTKNGVYDHNEVHLNEDSRTFLLNESNFTPTLTDTVFFKDGAVHLWYDRGTTNVVAITLYGQDNQTPAKYVTGSYTNPQSQATNGYIGGGAIAFVGLLGIVVGILWPRLPFARARAALPTAPPARRTP